MAADWWKWQKAGSGSGSGQGCWWDWDLRRGQERERPDERHTEARHREGGGLEAGLEAGRGTRGASFNYLPQHFSVADYFNASLL